MSLALVLGHALVLMCQGMAFSVAMNSKRAPALIALVIASNFGEIKGGRHSKRHAGIWLVLTADLLTEPKYSSAWSCCAPAVLCACWCEGSQRLRVLAAWKAAEVGAVPARPASSADREPASCSRAWQVCCLRSCQALTRQKRTSKERLTCGLSPHCPNLGLQDCCCWSRHSIQALRLHQAICTDLPGCGGALPPHAGEECK